MYTHAQARIQTPTRTPTLLRNHTCTHAFTREHTQNQLHMCAPCCSTSAAGPPHTHHTHTHKAHTRMHTLTYAHTHTHTHKHSYTPKYLLPSPSLIPLLYNVLRYEAFAFGSRHITVDPRVPAAQSNKIEVWMYISHTCPITCHAA